MEMMMNTPHAVGAAVRGARTRLGMSRAELGKRAGLSLNSVQMLEAGNGNPTLDTLLRVTSVLGLTLTAEPAQRDAPVVELPRSATSRKRAEAVARRYGDAKAHARVTTSATGTVTPKAAERVPRRVKAGTRAPMNLDALVEAYTQSDA